VSVFATDKHQLEKLSLFSERRQSKGF